MNTNAIEQLLKDEEFKNLLIRKLESSDPGIFKTIENMPRAQLEEAYVNMLIMYTIATNSELIEAKIANS